MVRPIPTVASKHTQKSAMLDSPFRLLTLTEFSIVIVVCRTVEKLFNAELRIKNAELMVIIAEHVCGGSPRPLDYARGDGWCVLCCLEKRGIYSHHFDRSALARSGEI